MLCYQPVVASRLQGCVQIIFGGQNMFALERLKRLGAVVLLAFCGQSYAAREAAETAESPSPQVAEEAVPVALSPHMVFERVIVGADGVMRSAPADDGGVAGAGERLIYSNTLGIYSINFPTNQPVSDDIATTAPNGCALKRYRFKVVGKVLPTGATGPFTVTYGLYTTCPLAVGSNNATRDLVRIPGTEGVLNFPDDGPRLIEHIVPAQTPVALPTNVYLSLRFNRGNCGTVVGAPAMIGYSGDIWDFPGFPCNGFLGGFPELPHASFWAEMFGSDDCAETFVAYKAERPSGGDATLGANVQGVDDAKLIVNDCQMTGYEVAVKGLGFYTFDLRRACTGQIIEGTERTFQVNASTVPQLQVARFNFDPPIPLNTDSVYLGFKCTSNSSGAIVAGIRPIIGESGSDYFKSTANGCEVVPPTTGVHGAINLAITCAGKLPRGACCDPYLTECRGGPDDGKRCPANALCVGGADDGRDCSPNKPCASPGVCTPYCAAPGTCEAVCRETTELNCPFPPHEQNLRPSWQAGKACEPDPFGPTHCGWGQCCGIRPNWQEVCDFSTKNWCDAATPVESKTLWQLGNFCDTSCPHVDCIGATGSCYITHPTAGCNDPFCCSAACSIPGPAAAFCCNTAWDETCVYYAEFHCSQPPPNDQCDGALTIPMPGSKATSNIKATTTPREPGFCCNNGAGACVGGSNAGDACIVNQDCASSVCSEQIPTPGGQGLGTIWFKFVQPVGQTSAGISTCTSNSPALDSILQVFTVGDNSSPQAACNSLTPIACNDDTANCGSTGRNSRVCLRNLTPGTTYYIELAAKTENRLGQYIVTISTVCNGTTPSCPNCPVGDVAFVNPPNNVVDARRPFPPNSPQSQEGIRTIVATAPGGASKECWSICQSPDIPAFVQIVSVVEAPPGTYAIQLNQAIAPGAVALITYTDKDGYKSVGRIIAHPGNVTADSQTNGADVLLLVDFLNGVGTLPWGMYSGDLNHNGLIEPSDILTLIDLLNGANGFTVWYGTEKPEAAGCP